VDDGGCIGLKKCVNTIGGHECQCILGYTENGGGCIGTWFFDKFINIENIFFKKKKIKNSINIIDINECSTNNGGCSANAKCTNTDGSFSCECNTGYSGDGFNCTGTFFFFFFSNSL